MLSERGWTSDHLLVLDLQTGEGAIFRPGGSARADLNEKHQVWVCPLFEPFMEWLYKQDTPDLTALPDQVELDAPGAPFGYRRGEVDTNPPDRFRGLIGIQIDLGLDVHDR